MRYIPAMKKNHPTKYDNMLYDMEQQALMREHEWLGAENRCTEAVEKSHGYNK